MTENIFTKQNSDKLISGTDRFFFSMYFFFAAGLRSDYSSTIGSGKFYLWFLPCPFPPIHVPAYKPISFLAVAFLFNGIC